MAPEVIANWRGISKRGDIMTLLVLSPHNMLGMILHTKILQKI